MAALHPFTYHYNDFPVFKDDVKPFKTFQEIRNAQYTESAEEVFNNKKLSDIELITDSFFTNFYGPTPQLKFVDGYDSAATAKEKQEEGDGDDQNQGG